MAAELSEILIMYGLLIMFGGVWPLCALAAFLSSFVEIRLDLWKLCMLSQRPLAERSAGLGPLWTFLLDAFTVAGITNHSFMLFVSSQTLTNYFFGTGDPLLSNAGFEFYYRSFLAFLAMSGLLGLFLLSRTLWPESPASWAVQARKEVLKLVGDAYRMGQQLREKRRVLMAVHEGTVRHLPILPPPGGPLPRGRPAHSPAARPPRDARRTCPCTRWPWPWISTSSPPTGTWC